MRPVADDSAAARLLQLARAAQANQDTALRSYDAESYQRVAVAYGAAVIGRDPMRFAFESVGRVRWALGVGARATLEGARTYGLVGDLTPPIPYQPGLEALAFKNEAVTSILRPFSIVHPFAAGAESLYVYEAGDSLSFRLPAGDSIHMRELRVRPRQASANLIVGSFWIETTTGRVVRAVYRPSATLDAWAQVRASADSSTRANAQGISGLAFRLLTKPFEVRVTSIAIEYGLYEQRFWLPRTRVLEGELRASIAHASMRVEQRFTYASVNAGGMQAPIVVQTGTLNLDTLKGREKADFVAGIRADQRAACAHAAEYTVTSMRDSVPVELTVPCDRSRLLSSAALPPSLFTSPNQVGITDIEAAITEGLPRGARFLTHLSPPRLDAGLSWFRFNRVEGVSLGTQLSQELGAGYSANLNMRFGFADQRPNVIGSLMRSNGRDSVVLSGYTRLDADNDWGNPFALTSSLGGLLFARDEGFYHRSSGIELTGTSGGVSALGFDTRRSWRLFMEHQTPADRELVNWYAGMQFIPNVAAVPGTWMGSAVRFSRTFGIDPFRPRASADIRVEAATGTTSYGRGMIDLTLASPIGRVVDGSLALSGGSSAGTLPAQRRWILGGANTVRGEVPDTANSGNAYWLARVGLTPKSAICQFVCPGPFADIGWVGSRAHFRDVGRPMSSVGFGFSLFSGAVHLDVARGLHPRAEWRTEIYLGTRF